jgi:hypothetical protein
MWISINGRNITDINAIQQTTLEKVLIRFLNGSIEVYNAFGNVDCQVISDSEDSYIKKTTMDLIMNYLNNHPTEELDSFQRNLKKFIRSRNSQSIPADLGFEASQNIIHKVYFFAGAFREHYIIEDIVSYCMFALVKMDNLNIPIRECQNCGYFFIPSSRSDEIYCDRIIKNGKSCKDIGYENKILSDPFSKAYRTAYKTKNAYKLRNIKNTPGVEKKFADWTQKAKEKLSEGLEGKISIEDFTKWLKEDL